MPGKDTEERKQHSTAYIPYSYYECRIPYDFANVPIHWHSEFEINYVLQGAGEFICGSDRHQAVKGDIFIILPNMLHGAYPAPESDLIYRAFVFHPSMLGAGAGDRCAAESVRPLMSGTVRIRTMVSGEAENYAPVKSYVEQIFSCADGGIAHADLLLKSELMRLFWMLETDKECVRREDGEVDYCEIIRPALEYMMGNYKKNITVSELAGTTHLSKSYFMNCFKRSTGVSAVEYLIQLRINAACEMLSSTEKKVSDVAFECGYGNLSNFNRQFIKMTGYSPKEYRKRTGRTVHLWDVF